MRFDPVAYIRSRPREEWQQLVLERWTDIRIWIQENGEKAAIVALVLGISLVVFYKLVIAIIAIGVIVVCAGWNIALPSDRSGDNSKAP